MAGALPRLRPRALAALVLTASALAADAMPQTTNNIPFGVTGHSSASGDASPNAALRPLETPRAPHADRVFELLNTTAENKSLINPFTPAAPALRAEESTPTPTPTPTPTLAPTSTPTPTPTPSRATPTPTPTPTSSHSALTPTPTPATPTPESSTETPSNGSGSNRRENGRTDGGPATGAISTAEETPSPNPPAMIKRTNVISFDVVRPPSGGNAEVKPAETAPAAPPRWSPPPTAASASSAPSYRPPPTAAAASGAPPPPPPPGAAPAPGAPAAPAAPAAPGAPAAPAAPGAPAASASLPGSSPSSAANPGTRNTPVVADSVVNVSASTNTASHSSSSHDPTVGRTAGAAAKSKKSGSTAGSGSNASVEAASQPTSSRYSMGLASILSIVGVIVGIGIIITLFILIGRRTYDDDDDRDVLGYGNEGGFNIAAGRPSVVRLSPTFLMNGGGSQPDFSLPSPLQGMGSNRGIRANSRPTGAVTDESPAIMERSIPPPRGQQPPIEGGARAPSARSSSEDDFSTMDRSSDGWSSVMESEFDLRSASRCTRDTNLSEYNSWEFTSQKTNRHVSGRFNPARRTAGGSTIVAPTPEYNFDEEDDDSQSVISFEVDDSTRRGDLDTLRSPGGSSVISFNVDDSTRRGGLNQLDTLRSSGSSVRMSDESELSEWSRDSRL